MNLFGDFSPLCGAPGYVKLDVVKLLIDHQQINLNVKDNYGNSALFYLLKFEITIVAAQIMTKVFEMFTFSIL